MTWSVDVLGTAVVVLLVAWYLSWTAARLDRLHARVEGARAALDAQLQRRASVTAHLATSGLLDPATAVLLAQAAHDAREAEAPEQEQRESELTAALCAAFDEPETTAELIADPAGAALLGELGVACQRVELSRRFHNGAVRSAQVVRRKRIVRLLRLAGRAPMPQTVELDDATPAALPRPGAYHGTGA